MSFIRRLLGVADKAEQANAKSAKAVPSMGGGEPVIANPGVVVQAGPVTPVVEGPLPSDTTPVPPLILDAETRAKALYTGTKKLTEPLPAYRVKPGNHVIFGLNSDVGMVRNNNQDAMYVFFGSSVSVEEQPDFGLFMVADGMGGHEKGERASAIALRTVAQHMMEYFYLHLLKKPATQTADADRPLIPDVLSEAVQKANQAVSKEIPQGGTTLTAATILGDLIYVAHVGDSRAYLITEDGIDQITRDHSLVQRLIELEHLTPEEAAAHPQRNVLYRALGQSENLEVDTVFRKLPPRSRLLLCSDGLWNNIDADRLREVVRSSDTPQEACDYLINLANDRGGSDNISVVIVQSPG